MLITKLKKHPFDIFLEIIGLIIIFGCFLFLALNYESLPDSLPRHYGSDGVPDAYGAKAIIWVLPIFGFFLYFVLGFISYLPGLINLPFNPSPENIEHYQRKYARMIRFLNVVMVGTFAFFTYQSVQIGLGTQSQLPGYFKLVSLGLLLGIPLIYLIPDMLKAKRKK